MVTKSTEDREEATQQDGPGFTTWGIGFKPGSTIRNLLIGLIYLILWPLGIALLITSYVRKRRDSVEGATDEKSVSQNKDDRVHNSISSKTESKSRSAVESASPSRQEDNPDDGCPSTDGENHDFRFPFFERRKTSARKMARNIRDMPGGTFYLKIHIWYNRVAYPPLRFICGKFGKEKLAEDMIDDNEAVIAEIRSVMESN